MDQKIQLVLLPATPSPLSVLGLFVAKRFGDCVPSPVIRFTSLRPSGLWAGDGLILKLVDEKEVYEFISKKLTIYGRDIHKLRRLLTFCAYSPKLKKHDLSSWLWSQTTKVNTQERNLEFVELTLGWFRFVLGGETDPWSQEIPKPINVKAVLEKPLPPDSKYLSLPIFNETKHKMDADILQTGVFKLHEGQIQRLASSRLVIAVGGPANSGKSTLAISLAREMQSIAKSLGTRYGWEDFDLKAQLVDGDLATPTSGAITVGPAPRSSQLKSKKRRWSTDLACLALHRLDQKRAQANITITDLPGGKVDHITHLTAGIADFGIIISNDWDKVGEWQSLFAQLGIPVISKIRSRQPDEGFSSVVTHYKPGKTVGGRTVGLNRTDRSWDRLVSWLAEILLFDILPARTSQK